MFGQLFKYFLAWRIGIAMNKRFIKSLAVIFFAVMLNNDLQTSNNK